MWRRWFEQQWQYKGWAQCLLLPLTWLFASLAALRRALYRAGLFSSSKLPVPVIVVGNISVGGVGKTPLVIYLANALRAAGYHPGILSRGYGGQHTGKVTPTSMPAEYGDEPVLIAHRTACPVWVHPLRAESGRALLQAYPQTDVLICDDGLQHYDLQRDIEIAVVQRPHGLGNGRLLPAGPLRESLSRLQKVDVIVETGQLPIVPLEQPCFQQSLQAGEWTAVSDFSSPISAQALKQKPLLAIAGIGHPHRFFDSLIAMGLVFETRVFADHYAYTRQDFQDAAGKTLLMTEKDAVKCRHLDLNNAWFLPVTAELTPIGHQQTLAGCVLGLLKNAKEI
ncbi:MULTISPECIES: tetraacyldisaccharide 4'-kinase [unclassified Methylophilus]|uniref:tetraacyldisaccharide 4'-kinase n=1 Tax=unclassified Methylophilus TaxID=2630143 RepID=UPI0007022E30|nr:MULTISPECIES: tetraacyldisaccharide 4'-kinase [unclassified Methylophilus]KQT43737.1 tetraacyldisaccharide 4'-kinase [Methylophilus sp. Leaf416]KQT59223.1 tetraacyldisaccharide 4'-kinase [Methylophilus sp. Leaf459]